MFARVLGLFFKNTAFASSQGMCNPYSSCVLSLMTVSRDIVRELFEKVPFCWSGSGAKSLLFIASVSESKYYFNRAVLKVLLESFSSKWRVGLFFSDLPDPYDTGRKESLAVKFLCNRGKVEEFLNLEKYRSIYCPPEKYGRIYKDVEEREEYLYSRIFRAGIPSFPVIILETGRVYAITVIFNKPVPDKSEEEEIKKILSGILDSNL